MHKQTRKIKFAVGTPDALWTSAWFIATNTKGDVYVGNVGSLGFNIPLKLSFHATGPAHFRYYGWPELGALANKFVQQWERPPTPAPGLTHVFSVHFPIDFLYARMPHNYKKQFLVPAPIFQSDRILVKPDDEVSHALAYDAPRRILGKSNPPQVTSANQLRS